MSASPIARQLLAHPRMAGIRRRVSVGQRAFSLIELLVCVAIIATLAGLMLPTLGTVKRYAQHVQCAGNVRQLIMGSLAYGNDYAGRLPPYSADANYFYPSGIRFLSGTVNSVAADEIAHGYGNFTFLNFLWSDYVSHPGVFFCPRVANPAERWLPTQWGGKTTFIFRYLQRDSAYYYRSATLSSRTGQTVLINEPTVLNWSKHAGDKITELNGERLVGASFGYADGHVLVLYPGMAGYVKSICPFY